MKELLEYILTSLVVYPDEIVVDEQVLADGLIILSVSANKEDYGRIIGRQGMLIQALRTIIKARAIKEKKKVMVRVMTDDVKAIPGEETPAAAAETTTEVAAPAAETEEVPDDNIV